VASAGGTAHGAAAAAASGGALCAGSSGSCSQAYIPSAGLDAAVAGQAYQGGLVANAAHAVYLCDPRTEDECLARSLLGLPASQAQVVRGIVPEQSLLFLFNVRSRLLFGVFRATSWPEHNIEPLAWGHETGVSRYPLQVRVRLLTPYVLQLPESTFREVLDYHGTFNRFDLQLDHQQASSLVSLFHHFGVPRQPSAGGCASEQPAGSCGVDVARARSSRLRAVRNGVIFICDSVTEQECLARCLLGLPKTQVSLLSKVTDSSLLFLFNVRTRQLMGVFQPTCPAGMDLVPSAWGGRFPVQVRFRPLQTHAWSGQVLSLPESSVSDVLRYRSASTRFDLLLRGQQLERLLAVFAHAGMPVGTATGLQPQQLVPTGSDAYLEPALPFGLLAPAPTAIGHISPQTEPSPHTSPLGHLSPQPLGHGSPSPLGQSSPPLLGHASPLGHLSPQPPGHRSPPGHGSPPGLEPQPLSAGLVMPGPLGGHLQTAGQPHAPPTEQRCAPSSLLTPTQLLGPGHGPSPAEQTMLRVSTALEALGLHNPPPGTRAQAEPHNAPSRRPL